MYPLFMIFALTPHVSEEAYQRELDKLHSVHGVDLVNDCKLIRLPWDPSYQVNSNTAAEHFVNPIGSRSSFDYQLTGAWKPQERAAYDAMMN